MDQPLGLFVSNIMGPFNQDPQGFQYLLTICNHVLTYSIVYPLKSRLDALAAILDAIAHLSIQLGISRKALQMDNSREFVSASLTAALSKLGIGLHPSLPYLPQENGKAERLNCTLACYLHNGLPNRWCPDSLPHQVLYGRPPSIAALYLFGERAIMQMPAVQQLSKLAERGIEYRLLKPLLASGGWLLWDPAGNQMIHLVPMELYFERKEKAISSLPLAKDISVPENLRQALVGPHQHHWEQACLGKLDQMKRQGVWQAINRTPTMKTIGHCWVFNTKFDEYGNIEKFKARLVARGNPQRPGVECTETGGDRADGTTHPFHPVLHLQKALYHMKQASHCWWLHLSGILGGLGFTLCEVDLSLYVFQKDEAIIVIWIHVDNGVIASNSPTQLKEFRKELCNNFEIKWSDTMKQIVGLECAIGEGEVAILQTKLTKDIINTYPRKIFQHDCPLPPMSKMSLDEQEAVVEATPFRSIIGSLAYLVSGSRLDLAFAVNYLARHLTVPTGTHWTIFWGICSRPGDTGLLSQPVGWRAGAISVRFMLKLGDTPFYGDQNKRLWWRYQHVPPSTSLFPT
ncbi:hypothetical protein O181_034429 [Austropuccinia psidii MF-1]|uniref:Integrase catalytic domain-containing protein n=1 Tax=Austropuccinia psidii MF-1 TaxID=1389203 RepID=A0A9Q3D0Q0_9BASI|nr:hypothetical protein [Austropuccinia psidii MF-1]